MSTHIESCNNRFVLSWNTKRERCALGDQVSSLKRSDKAYYSELACNLMGSSS